MTSRSIIGQLAAAILGQDRADYALSVLEIAPALLADGPRASRAQVAMALNLVLFARLLDDVPTAARHVAGVAARGERLCFDHGALRTIDGPTGALPAGHAAFARLLEPLGYEVAGLYPLPRLRMTGRAYAHRDLPEAVPQFFVSELHVADLPEDAQAAAARIFGTSRDPIGKTEQALLDALAAAPTSDAACDLDLARAGLPGLARAFGRQHDTPALADYETLRDHSAEGAWIATEGNAFNHATDRVPDVAALAERLRTDSWPIKDRLEISANARVRQTAFRADMVTRRFRLADGRTAERTVPGSFYEFISRDIDPATGRLDLTFDSGNATGIFAMTRVG
ncbi:MAG TPA: DUF1338 family protein [Sphingobium sp.]